MSMSMVHKGHVAHAAAMFNEVFHLAWGDLGVDYPDPWGQNDTPPDPLSIITTATVVRGAGVEDNLNKTGVLKVVTLVDTNGVSYTYGVDYTLEQGKINWTLAASGGKKPAEGVSYTATLRCVEENILAPLNELGRRVATDRSFVIRDDNGPIIAEGTRWSRVSYPTENLFLQFAFEGSEAINSSIYQTMLFIGTVAADGVPPGKQYLLPSEVKDKGTPYMVENHQPFPRNSGKREIFEYVITY